MPSFRQWRTSRARDENLFVMEDLHNFGAYYDKTLLAWHVNALKGTGRKSRTNTVNTFISMWRYYLLTNAGARSAARQLQLWQLVFSGEGITNGYERVS